MGEIDVETTYETRQARQDDRARKARMVARENRRRHHLEG